MRTIKFRGKRLYDGKWVYGYVLGHDTLPYMAIVTMNNTDKSVINKTTTSVKHDTIGQFTGLYDKNGKEIYEGDILLWTRKNVHIEGHQLQDFSDKCVVYYDNDKCAFQFRCKLDCGSCVGILDFRDDRAKESYIEVIGNIYDSLKLLENERETND